MNNNEWRSKRSHSNQLQLAMTIPKEVRERIEREAREAAEVRYVGYWDGSIGGYYVCMDVEQPEGQRVLSMSPNSEAALIDRMRQAYAACYVRLKSEEWERERWIPVPKELGPWPPDGSVLTFDPTKQVGQRIEQRSNYVGEWPKTVTLYRHLPQPPTQP